MNNIGIIEYTIVFLGGLAFLKILIMHLRIIKNQVNFYKAIIGKESSLNDNNSIMIRALIESAKKNLEKKKKNKEEDSMFQ